MAGIKLPIESHVLQAMVSEPVKPVLDTVVTSGAVHFYISQSDRGELVMGGDLDFYNSYAQRGNLPMIQNVVSACLALFPSFGRLRLMRAWGGIVDMTMDGSPIIGKLPVEGLYMTGGWCYGGFKATPASGYVHAWTIANDEPHPLNAAFTLERFAQGRTIDERALAPIHGRIESGDAMQMMLIPCPWCGQRNQTEFTYGGDATLLPASTRCSGVRHGSTTSTCATIPADPRRALVPRGGDAEAGSRFGAIRVRMTSSPARDRSAVFRR